MVVSQALDRLRGWSGQLLPPQVLITLDDGVVRIGALPLGGRPRLRRLWNLALPEGTCADGMPRQITALGDFIGDVLVEQGLVQAQVQACLPPAAARWRLLRWPGGQPPADPLGLAREREAELGLDWPLDDTYLDVLPLPGEPAAALLLAARRELVQAWHEVFDLAGADLVRLEPAQTCEWRALASLDPGRGPGEEGTTAHLVLALEPTGSWLWLAHDGRPGAEWGLPALRGSPSPAALAQLAGELEERRQWWQERHPAIRQWHCWLHGPLAASEGVVEALQGGQLAATVERLDPLERGWLHLPPSEPDGASPAGCELLRLQGLLAGVEQP